MTTVVGLWPHGGHWVVLCFHLHDGLCRSLSTKKAHGPLDTVQYLFECSISQFPFGVTVNAVLDGVPRKQV